MVLAPLAIWAVVTGGLFFAVLLGLTLLLALHELYRMARLANIPVPGYPGFLLACTLMVFAYLHVDRYSGLALIVASLWIVGQSFRSPLEGRLAGLTFGVFGVAYVIGLGMHLFWLRSLPHGERLVLLVLLSTWAADVGAFFTGITVGKTLLAPAISPKKTVEGFMGGVLLTVLVTVVMSRLLIPDMLALWGALLLGLILGIIAPLGDLLESFIKRSLGAKDAAHLIPGHGGVLDRIDSLLFTAPVLYYTVQLLTRSL